MSEYLTPLLYVGEMRCPTCREPVKLWSEAGEALRTANPPRCPECKTALLHEALALLAAQSAPQGG